MEKTIHNIFHDGWRRGAEEFLKSLNNDEIIKAEKIILRQTSGYYPPIPNEIKEITTIYERCMLMFGNLSCCYFKNRLNGDLLTKLFECDWNDRILCVECIKYIGVDKIIEEYFNNNGLMDSHFSSIEEVEEFKEKCFYEQKFLNRCKFTEDERITIFSQLDEDIILKNFHKFNEMENRILLSRGINTFNNEYIPERYLLNIARCDDDNRRNELFKKVKGCISKNKLENQCERVINVLIENNKVCN